MHSNYNKRIAKNYAQVLFDQSIKYQVIDPLFKSFSLLLDQLKESFLLRKLLKNPLLSKEDQKNVLAPFITPSLDPFFSFIIQKKRLPLLDLIAVSFIERVETYKNQGHAFLETTHSLTKNQKNTLSQKLQSLLKLKTLTIREQLSPELLGGFRLKIQGKVFDASLKTRAQNILKESHV